CWSLAYGYPCCKETTKVWATDESGTWGYENNQWCGIEDLYQENNEDCWASILNYPCCEGNKVYMTDEYGSWGYEFGRWCGI
ncbi:Non-catalytic module family DOC2, partial [Piromyces sp. E2]